VTSNKDVASLNIKQQILNYYPFAETGTSFQRSPTYEARIADQQTRLITLNEESVHAQALPYSFSNLELIVFISRHSSLSGKPTLSVHTPGNLNEAELGGLPRMVSISPANAMRDAIKTLTRLKAEMELEYEVCYEGTHHGPSLDVPTMFVELGSSPTQWSDTKAAEAVGRAAIEAITKFKTSTAKAVLGIGGPHYNATFTRIAQENEVAFGHMIPKYAIPPISTVTIRQCVEHTLEKVEDAVLDWKGIKGENKQPLLAMLEEAGLRYEKA